MLKINEQPKFWADVKITYEGFEDESFRVCFKVRETGVDPDETVEAFLKEVVIDMTGIVKGDRKALVEVPFSPEILDQVIATPHRRMAIFKAYNAGLQRAVEGN